MEVTFMIVKKNEEEFGKYQHLDHRNIWNSTVNFWNTMLPTSTKFDIKQQHQNLGVNHFKNYWYFFTRNRCKFSLNHLGNPKKQFLLKYKRSRKWIKTKSPKSYKMEEDFVEFINDFQNTCKTKNKEALLNQCL